MTSDAEVVYTGVRIGMQNEKITGDAVRRGV